jgi:phosphoenolpyruvate synthase/pyruvate phosphate dikinase
MALGEQLGGHILVEDPNLGSSEKEFFISDPRRGVNSASPWYSASLPTIRVQGVASNAFLQGKLNEYFDQIKRWVLSPPQLDVVLVDKIETYASAPPNADALVMLMSDAERLKSAPSLPVLELLKKDGKPGPLTIPLHSYDSRVFLKAVARAANLAPVAVVSERQQDADKLAFLLNKMGTYFSPHSRSWEKYNPEEAQVQNGVVVYLEDPSSGDYSPANTHLSDLVKQKCPVVYFRLSKYWKIEELTRLVDAGLFDFVNGEFPEIFFDKSVREKKYPQEKNWLPLATLERLINSVHNAFLTKGVFEQDRRSAREEARSQMAHVLIHAPFNSAVSLMNKIPITIGSVLQYNHLAKFHQALFSEEALQHTLAIADAWQPNIVYVQLGRNPSKDSTTERNIDALYSIRRQIPTAEIILGYDPVDRKLGETIKHYVSGDRQIRVHTVPEMQEAPWEVFPDTWRDVKVRLQREYAKKAHKIRLEQYRGILEVRPSRFEELLSKRFAFEADPEVKGVGKPIHPGAASGWFYDDWENAEDAKRKRQPVIFYIDDISQLTISDIRRARSFDGIIFHRISGENHYTIDLQRSGVPMVQVEDVQAEPLENSQKSNAYRIGDLCISKGDLVSFSGTTGKFYAGFRKILPPLITADTVGSASGDDVDWFRSVLSKADGVLREADIELMINADTVSAAEEARKWGVYSIGLVRSENILKESPQRIASYGRLMLALLSRDALIEDQENELQNDGTVLSQAGLLVKKTLDDFVNAQSDAFYEIMGFQGKYRTQIRLLDPPVQDFFTGASVEELSKSLSGHYLRGKQKFLDFLKNSNIRGAQLLRWPEIYEGQLLAMFNAADKVRKERGFLPDLRIFVPYVDQTQQVRDVRLMMTKISTDLYGGGLGKLIDNQGVTLETPGGCSCARDMVSQLGIKNFALGTNDLFPLVDGTADRNRTGTSYTQYMGGIPILSNGILQLVDKTLYELRRSAEKKNQSCSIGLCGELNAVKLHHLNLGKFLNRVQYVSAGSPQQIPMLKLLVAQNYLLSVLK